MSCEIDYRHVDLHPVYSTVQYAKDDDPTKVMSDHLIYQTATLAHSCS
jgi:hypothetical protein